MAIHFISGKPRGGKSLYAVKLVIDELLFGNRPVYTNLALKLPELNEYIQRVYPRWMSGREEVRRLAEGAAYVPSGIARVRLLDDDEAGRFWTLRPGGVCIGQLTKKDWNAGKRPDYSVVADEGVFYLIDEIHNYFGARQWSLTGQDVLFYLSQHGKLGDTLVCVTQSVGNVDKQFRSVTQDYTYLRNLAKEKYGKFRMPQLFIRKTFASPPSDHSTPMESGSFRLDVSGLCSVYDTARGVGIHARGADTAERKRGLHWSLYFVGVLALLAVVFLVVPKVVALVFTGGGLLPHSRSAFAVGTGVSKSLVPSSAPVSGVSAVSRPVRSSESSLDDRRRVLTRGVALDGGGDIDASAPTCCVGKVWVNGGWSALLDDGLVYGVKEGLTEVNRQGVKIGGIFYRYHPREKLSRPGYDSAEVDRQRHLEEIRANRNYDRTREESLPRPGS